MIKTLFANGFSTPAGNLKIVKMYVSPSKAATLWSIRKNDLGIPAYKYSNQWFMVFVQDIKSRECYYYDFSLRQDYAGGGTYGKTKSAYGDYFFFACDKMGLK